MRRGDMLMCMATMMNQNLEGEFFLQSPRYQQSCTIGSHTRAGTMKLFIALYEVGRRWIIVYYIWIPQEQNHGENM